MTVYNIPQDVIEIAQGWVNTFADLPSAVQVPSQVFLVKKSSGIWFINRKTSGFYLSNGATWTYLGETPTYFNANNFEVYDNSDNTKGVGFDVSSILTGNKKLIFMPNYDVYLANLIAGNGTAAQAAVFSNSTTMSSTSLINVDSTNNRVGLAGISDPQVPVEVLAASQKAIYIRDSLLNHGMTSLASANVFFSMEEFGSPASGGAIFRALGGNNNSITPLFFQGISGHANPVVAAMIFRGGKKAATSYNVVGNTEQLIGFDNYVNRVMTILGSGFLGIGVNPPTSTLHVNGSVASANTSVSGSVSISASFHKYIFTSAGTATLPTSVGIKDREYVIKRASSCAGNVVILTTSSQTIDGSTVQTIGSAGDSLSVVSDNANWHIF